MTTHTFDKSTLLSILQRACLVPDADHMRASFVIHFGWSIGMGWSVVCRFDEQQRIPCAPRRRAPLSRCTEIYWLRLGRRQHLRRCDANEPLAATTAAACLRGRGRHRGGRRHCCSLFESLLHQARHLLARRHCLRADIERRASLPVLHAVRIECAVLS